MILRIFCRRTCSENLLGPPLISVGQLIVMIITGAVYISQLLNVTHTLQDLDMSYNDIGDDGMGIISEALRHTKSLTELGVQECGLSMKGTSVGLLKTCVASLNYHSKNICNEMNIYLVLC